MTYDTLFNTVYNGQYAQKISDVLALAAIGEYGSDQYRLNGTLGYQLHPEDLLKFSGEYLSQVQPFSFDSGDINQRVSQTAYGLRFKHDFNLPALQNINLGGYWAKAPNTGLSTINFLDSNGFEYINQRNLAGATTQGMDLGGQLTLTPLTSLDATINYDNVNYDTAFVSTPNYDAQGIGTTLALNQLIGDRIKLSADASNRKLYNIYGADIDYAPTFGDILNLKIGLFIQRLISNNQTPSSNTYGLSLTFFGDAPATSQMHFNNQYAQTNIGEWVKTPAIYMDRVLVVSEQTTTLAETSVSSISPNSGAFGGGETVTITGVNFVSGTTVFFGTQEATSVTIISPTELTTVVPAYTVSTLHSRQSLTVPSSPVAVDVIVKTPNNQNSVFPNAYTYTNNTTTTPTITSINSSIGNTTGGNTVTLTGTHLASTSAITFGGINATSFTVVDDATVTAVAPTHYTGTVTIEVTTPTGNAETAYIYQPGPSLTSISPATGSTAGGYTIILTGFGLTGATSVVLNGTSVALSASNVNAAGTQITFTAPTHTPGLVSATVIVGSAGTILPNCFIYNDGSAPVLSSLTPTSGPITGGTTVTLTGVNLGTSTTTHVNFGSSAATSVTVSTDGTTATVITPNVSSTNVGLVTVSLSITGMAASTSLSNSYTYTNGTAPQLTSITPSSGTTAGGTTVQLRGANLTGTTAVTIGGIAATIISINTSGTRVTAVTPAHTAASGVTVTLTSNNGTSSLASTSGYSYTESPVITAITPSSTTVNTTPAQVTLSGSNLSDIHSITFGGISGTINNVTSTTIIATPPSSTTAKTVDVVAMTSTGSSSILPQSYSYF